MKQNTIWIILICFLLVAMSCNLMQTGDSRKGNVTPSPGEIPVSPGKPTPTTIALPLPLPGKATPVKSPSFGKISFCLDFDDQNGKPIDPAVQFAEGTPSVYMLFTFENMPKGQVWSLEFSREGRQMEGIDQEPWDDDENGWTAYELSEDLSNNPLAGRYQVRLLIGEKVVQNASFEVAAAPVKSAAFPAFGPIQFAANITDDGSPINPSASYPPGTSKVYGVFPYAGMANGLPFARQWLRDGKETARRDLTWEEGESGITYGSLENKEGLASGVYTLNLYINNQIARSATFTIEAPKPTPTTQRQPAKPETLFDAALLPTYQYLATFPSDNVRGVAEFLLSHHVKIKIDPKYNGLASFSYTCTTEPPKYAGDVGEIKISTSFFNKSSRVELAGVLLHETTHAIQRTQGMKCGCTVEKEYHAYSVQGGFWAMAGRGDLVTDYVGKDIFDYAGKFDKNKFWQAVKKIYNNCPDY